MNNFNDIAFIGKPFVPVYAATVAVRNWCYDRKIFSVGKVDTPVISVGNLTTGGNGKTPLTEYLVRYFLSQKRSVGVLSRGYKRSTRGTRIVSDGKTIHGTARDAGDEPYQVAGKFPDAFVVVDEDRLRGASVLQDTFHPDLILLDDAFQHRRLDRDLDIVLIDGKELLNGVHLLPAGKLREPLKGLRRADCIILTNCGESYRDACSVVRQYAEGFFPHAEIRPVGLVQMSSRKKIPVNQTPSKDCAAFCAIAKPDNFLSTLMTAGFSVKLFQSFHDHHIIRSDEFERLEKEFRASGASFMITTEKDAVRLEPGHLPRAFPLDACYFVEVETVILEGEYEFHSLLDQTVREAA